MRNIIYLISLVFCVSNIYAQKKDNSIPESIKLGLNDYNTLISTKKLLPSLNLTALAVHDQQDEQNGLPPRFGYPVDVNYNLTNSGIWKDLSNGDRIWRLEINCNNAISINLLYDKFWLPIGAKLHLYTKDKSQIIGGFNYLNNKGTKQNPSKFTTGLLFSDTIILELYEPLSVQNQSILSIDKVVHGYREINLKSVMTNESGHGDSGPCQVNVNCSEGQNWQNEKKGVAMILVNGTRWCSGSLINNTSNNQTPYFLTADHCIGSLDANGDTDASYYSFWWNYESSSCIQNSTDFVASSTSGATLVSNNSATDFALFELTESPLDSNIDVYFNGWDRTTSPSQGGVGIHHPSGDFKKIATHNVVPSQGQVWGASTHWRVNWSQTANGYSVTEGGSSGSPLFTNDKIIIGQLHGGSSINCSDPANDPGEYGRLHVSWDGSSPQRRLKDWLDPLGTDQIFLNGIGTVSFQEDIDYICIGETLTLNINNTQNSVNWNVSSNLQITSSNNNSVTFTTNAPSSSGIGWVQGTLNNGITIQEDFEVGIPNSVSNASINGNTSICDTQYYTYNLVGANHPCISSVNWSVSPNLTIVSQNSTSVTVTRNPFNNQYAGLITASLSNSNITIQKGIWIGTPSNNGLVIQKIGSYDLYAGRWSKLRAVYSPLIYEANDPLNVTFEWQIPNSAIRNYADTAYKDVKPFNSGQLNIGVRAICECGNGEWQYRLFDVGGGNNTGPIELIPADGN